MRGLEPRKWHTRASTCDSPNKNPHQHNTTQQRWVTPIHRCSRISCRGVTVRSPLIESHFHSLSHRNHTGQSERNNPLTFPFPHSRPRRSRQTTKAFHEIGQSVPPSPSPFLHKSTQIDHPIGRIRYNRARRIPTAPPSFLQPAGHAHDRHLRRRRRRRRRFPGVRVRPERFQQQGQQGGEAAVRIQGVRY